MSYEFNLYINGKESKAFVQNFLMNAEHITRVIHCHRYAEVHIICGGYARFLIDDEVCDFSSGSVCIIPRGTYHCCIENSESAKHIAFQTEAIPDGFASGMLSETMVNELVGMIEEKGVQSDCGALSALLSFACSPFFDKIRMKKMTDRAAVIHEFISKNYNKDIKVSDLAEVLHFSDKQTERLVKKYTGVTFKNALADYRITVAEYLEKNTSMNEAEIAAYVGYSTYSGFWKAKKKRNAAGQPD